MEANKKKDAFPFRKASFQPTLNLSESGRDFYNRLKLKPNRKLKDSRTFG